MKAIASNAERFQQHYMCVLDFWIADSIFKNTKMVEFCPFSYGSWIGGDTAKSLVAPICPLRMYVWT